MLSTSSLNSLTDSRVIEYALVHGLNFALYHLPGRDNAKCIISANLWLDCDFKHPGFLIAPFKNDDINFLSEDWSREFPLVKVRKPQINSDNHIKPVPDAYQAKVLKIIQRLIREGGKTVFATVHEGQCEQSLYDTFMQLADAYPGAFVFCWKLAADSAAWIGATPELLARFNGNSLTTMALAGTRKPGTAAMPWDNKNIAEQEMVRDFIVDKLNSNNLSINETSTFTLKAGPVEHICTQITADIPDNFCHGSFLKELSPTPAVSGLPRDKALAEINELEDFDREYYAGYSGVITPEESELFVTLRCMKVYIPSGKCTLYTGGGITAHSNPESEWREVNIKASTLSSALGIKLNKN
ncbi:MAG: chorismate-binding protein [Ruminococcus sp.]|nr:chorismate-binding protein [Ruminococcus sp.]